MSVPRKAVVLLSGGLDSYTAAAIAKAEGYELYALTVRYGQVHTGELTAARRIARTLAVRRHLELTVDLGSIGGSALTGGAPVPKDRVLTPAIPPPTFRRATPCCSRSRWGGRRCSAPAICSSA